jgi:hypothetical protein
MSLLRRNIKIQYTIASLCYGELGNLCLNEICLSVFLSCQSLHARLTDHIM